MADPFLIVGVMKTEDGFTIVDPTKEEHPCADGDAIQATFEKLLASKEMPETETTKTKTRNPRMSGRRQAREVEVLDDDIDALSSKLDEYVSSQFGNGIGARAGQAAADAGKGLVGFMRKVSRP